MLRWLPFALHDDGSTVFKGNEEFKVDNGHGHLRQRVQQRSNRFLPRFG